MYTMFIWSEIKGGECCQPIWICIALFIKNPGCGQSNKLKVRFILSMNIFVSKFLCQWQCLLVSSKGSVEWKIAIFNLNLKSLFNLQNHQILSTVFLIALIKQVVKQKYFRIQTGWRFGVQLPSSPSLSVGFDSKSTGPVSSSCGLDSSPCSKVDTMTSPDGRLSLPIMTCSSSTCLATSSSASSASACPPPSSSSAWFVGGDPDTSCPLGLIDASFPSSASYKR